MHGAGIELPHSRPATFRVLLRVLREMWKVSEWPCVPRTAAKLRCSTAENIRAGRVARLVGKFSRACARRLDTLQQVSRRHLIVSRSGFRGTVFERFTVAFFSAPFPPPQRARFRRCRLARHTDGFLRSRGARLRILLRPLSGRRSLRASAYDVRWASRCMGLQSNMNVSARRQTMPLNYVTSGAMLHEALGCKLCAGTWREVGD